MVTFDTDRLRVTRPGLCPELALWLLSPCADLDGPHDVFPEGATPYWAFCWASGQAMARTLLDGPDRVAGQRVLDVGAGSGVAGIAAALAGARAVGFCDTDPVAREACRRNAALNGVAAPIDTFSTLGDALDAGRWDVVVASDVCYEVALRDALAELRTAGCRVLVGDPGRAAQPFDAEPVVARHVVRTLPELDEATTGATVRELRAPRTPASGRA